MAGTEMTLRASDGHQLRGWLVLPPAGIAVRGGLIVAQEAFGVNEHMRYMCARFAARGYASLAPYFYDRAQPGGFVADSYGEADLAAAIAMMGKLSTENTLLDCAAAKAVLDEHGRVGMIGYCAGGAAAWQAAARLEGLACAVSYYGGGAVQNAELEPRCPVMMHWGAEDGHIPLDAVRALEARHPEVTSFIYAGAGHGFSCDVRASFNPDAAALAWKRSIGFLDLHIGGEPVG